MNPKLCNLQYIIYLCIFKNSNMLNSKHIFERNSKNIQDIILDVLLFRNIFLCKYIPLAIIFYNKESIILFPTIS